jgi:hypothetical protein
VVTIAIVSISLVVGGIVIANIMLVMLMERTPRDRCAKRCRGAARHPAAILD